MKETEREKEGARTRNFLASWQIERVPETKGRRMREAPESSAGNSASDRTTARNDQRGWAAQVHCGRETLSSAPGSPGAAPACLVPRLREHPQGKAVMGSPLQKAW